MVFEETDERLRHAFLPYYFALERRKILACSTSNTTNKAPFRGLLSTTCFWRQRESFRTTWDLSEHLNISYCSV